MPWGRLYMSQKFREGSDYCKIDWMHNLLRKWGILWTQESFEEYSWGHNYLRRLKQRLNKFCIKETSTKLAIWLVWGSCAKLFRSFALLWTEEGETWSLWLFSIPGLDKLFCLSRWVGSFAMTSWESDVKLRGWVRNSALPNTRSPLFGQNRFSGTGHSLLYTWGGLPHLWRVWVIFSVPDTWRGLHSPHPF